MLKELYAYYFRDRVQHDDHVDRVNIHTVQSQKIEGTQSIPHGGVLGFMLFLLYINDFLNIIAGLCTVFVDDVSILISCKSDTELNTKHIIENRQLVKRPKPKNKSCKN